MKRPLILRDSHYGLSVWPVFGVLTLLLGLFVVTIALTASDGTIEVAIGGAVMAGVGLAIVGKWARTQASLPWWVFDDGEIHQVVKGRKIRRGAFSDWQRVVRVSGYRSVQRRARGHELAQGSADSVSDNELYSYLVLEGDDAPLRLGELRQQQRAMEAIAERCGYAIEERRPGS